MTTVEQLQQLVDVLNSVVSQTCSYQLKFNQSHNTVRLVATNGGEFPTHHCREITGHVHVDNMFAVLFGMLTGFTEVSSYPTNIMSLKAESAQTMLRVDFPRNSQSLLLKGK